MHASKDVFFISENSMYKKGIDGFICPIYRVYLRIQEDVKKIIQLSDTALSLQKDNTHIN